MIWQLVLIKQVFDIHDLEGKKYARESPDLNTQLFL